MALFTRKSAGARGMLRLKRLCKTGRVDKWLATKVRTSPGKARKAKVRNVLISCFGPSGAHNCVVLSKLKP